MWSRLVGRGDMGGGPVFWVVAACLPPVVSDVAAGQRGGILLLGGTASIALEANRPALAGVVGGLVAAVKFYPPAMVIGTRPEHRIRYPVPPFPVPPLLPIPPFLPPRFSRPALYFHPL